MAVRVLNKKEEEIYFAGRKAVIKEVGEWIKSHELIAPDKDSLTRFEPFYQIEYRELKEWLGKQWMKQENT